MKNWCAAVSLVVVSVIGLRWVGAPSLSPRLAGLAEQPTRTYHLDPTQSKLHVSVDKAGWLKAFGHDHLMAAKDFSGTVRVSPAAIERGAVTLQIATDSLAEIAPTFKPQERQDIERDMKSEKVLHVAKYSQITFVSTGVSDVKPAGDSLRLTLIGDLTLHGLTRQVAIPVLVTLTETSLRAQGEFTLTQTHYGITPISVKAALGGIRVKDEVGIVFDLVAQAK